MTRIVFYNHTGQMSGAEVMLLLGLDNLPRDQFDPVLVCPDSGPLTAVAASRGLKVYPGSPVKARFTANPFALIRYAFSLLGGLAELRRTFRKLQPDIIHANTVRAGVAATMATIGMKTPVVWHNHDMLPSSHPLTLAIRVLIWASDRVWMVACSRAAANTLRPLTRRQRASTVIYNGCEINAQTPDSQWRAVKREQLGIAPENFAIAIVGQITPRKRQLEAIRAFAQARVHVPKALLIVCGAPLFNNDTLYLQSLHQEVSDLGIECAVRFLGQRSDAVEVIAAADLCLLNSSKEPFGLTIVEAMSSGTPVIATNCGGPSEIVRHGIDGEIVSVHALDETVQAIIRLAADPELRGKYAAAAAQSTRERFSRQRYIYDWCALYAEIRAGQAYLAEYPYRSAGLSIGDGAHR